MPKSQSVISLDPIDRQKQKGFFARFLVTRRFGGVKLLKSPPFGHYLFVGKQRAGKTVSAVWFCEHLTRLYSKKHKKIILYSNIGLALPVKRSNFYTILNSLEYDSDVIYIFLIDEIQSWFPKDTKNKDLLEYIDYLTGEFSQLGKRQIFVLSTAQVYGRVNKNLREQCFYMVNCRLGFNRRCVNDFILGDDVMCDDLGRWSGDPQFIYTHGLAKKLSFDTHKRVIIS